jgi:anti-sigma B factor antagonist
MSVKLNTRQVGDVTIIDVSGRVTLGEGSSLIRETMRDLTTKGIKKILLNLSDVSYIDSAGIGELAAGFTSAANAGGKVKLLGLTKHVKDVLQITRLYKGVGTDEDEAEAVRSFASAGRRVPIRPLLVAIGAVALIAVWAWRYLWKQ